MNEQVKKRGGKGGREEVEEGVVISSPRLLA